MICLGGETKGWKRDTQNSGACGPVLIGSMQNETETWQEGSGVGKGFAGPDETAGWLEEERGRGQTAEGREWNEGFVISTESLF